MSVLEALQNPTVLTGLLKSVSPDATPAEKGEI